MASESLSSTTRPFRVHPSLVDLLDAYEAFCNHGSLRISWRNLSVFLIHYLRHYYKTKDNTLPARKRSPRPAFLAQLPIDIFGHVLCEVVYVLLRQIPTLPFDIKLIPWRFCVLELHTASENVALLDLPAPQLHSLLLDVSAELEFVTDPTRGGLSFVRSDWKPTASHPTSVYTEELLPYRSLVTLDNVLRPSFLEASKNLLRRALSGGSRARPRPRVVDRSQIGRPVTLGHEVRMTGFDMIDLKQKQPQQDEERLPTYDESMALQPYQSPRQPFTGAPLPAVEEEEDTVSIHSYVTVDSLIEICDQAPKDREPSAKSFLEAPRRDSIEIARRRRGYTVTSVTSKSLTDDHSRGVSVSSGYGSFVTAQNHLSVTVSNRQSSSRPGSIATFLSITTATIDDSLHYGPYQKLLQEKDLLPEPMMENDWSGRGQHVEYGQDEAESIPLHLELLLGRTRNAVVESVRCKRIRMVRKTMRCTKWTGLKRKDVVREVQQLYRVQHSHVVRLVGTYAIGNEVSILTYPCAEWNLEVFMREAPMSEDVDARCKSLRQFFTCLSKVLDFMHSCPLKHMDIKPQNLLVRDIRHSSINESDPFKIYLTDFGISRSYPSIEACETESPTSFTRAYAAMEVVLQEARGLPADVFSLGCVYTEMIATILDCSPSSKAQTSNWEMLQQVRGRTHYGIRPYHSAVDNVRGWLSGLSMVEQPELKAVADWTHQMLDSDPEKRPAARQIAEDPHLPFACLSCTLRTGPEDFEAAEPLHADIHIP